MKRKPPRTTRFDLRLSREIDAIHAHIAHLRSDSKSFANARRLAILQNKLNELEKRVKV